MKSDKLQKLLRLADMLEQSALATTRNLRANHRAIEGEIAGLSIVPKISADDTALAQAASLDHWYVWRQEKLVSLKKARDSNEVELRKASVVARQNMGRRQALETAAARQRLDNKRLIERRASEVDCSE